MSTVRRNRKPYWHKNCLDNIVMQEINIYKAVRKLTKEIQTIYDSSKLPAKYVIISLLEKSHLASKTIFRALNEYNLKRKIAFFNEAREYLLDMISLTNTLYKFNFLNRTTFERLSTINNKIWEGLNNIIQKLH